jgi:cell fate regulator YaaT (PSP1 superfamily)
MQNINDKLFPTDFFEPILPREEKQLSVNNKNINKSTKSTYVSLQKEYDEDKELLDLLTSSKRN